MTRDYTEHARDCENEAFGAFLIDSIAQSCGFSGDEDELPRRIDRAVYKGTDCGAWVRFDEKGILVGTIVECGDAEFSERIDLAGIEQSEAGEDELCKRFWAAVQRCEDFAAEQWAEAEANGDEYA